MADTSKKDKDFYISVFEKHNMQYIPVKIAHTWSQH